MFNIFDHMQPSTLAEIVAAGLKMQSASEEDRNVYRNARAALVANQGQENARKAIKAALDDID